MTKEPTKADLLKTIKKQDAAVRKLTKALNFEKDKLEASQAVAAAYLRTMQDAGVARGPLPRAAHGGPVIEEWPFGHGDAPVMPWDCLPNPYEDNK